MTVKNIGNTGVEFPDSSVQGSAAYTKAESDAIVAFSVWTAININIAALTFQLVNFNQEDFDTANAHSGGVFTAPISGYYQINGAIVLNIGTVTACLLIIFKNGLRYCDIGAITSPLGNTGFAGGALVYLAAGDTIDLRVYSAATGNQIIGTDRNNSNFSGFLVRKA